MRRSWRRSPAASDGAWPNDTPRQPNHNGDQPRRHTQLDGCRQAGHKLSTDWRVRREGLSEVTVQHSEQESTVLYRQRLVETEFLPQPRQGFRHTSEAELERGDITPGPRAA